MVAVLSHLCAILPSKGHRNIKKGVYLSKKIAIYQRTSLTFLSDFLSISNNQTTLKLSEHEVNTSAML